MEQNSDQTQLLHALYQQYLTESIQLKEQLAQANLTIQNLEEKGKAGEPSAEASDS